MRTQDNFNLNFESGQSFAYQDILNNATVTVTVVSGSLLGSGSFNANNNGGSLAVAPLTAGIIQINATKPIYLYYNSQYLQDNLYSYAASYQFTLTWTYISPLSTPVHSTGPTPTIQPEKRIYNQPIDDPLNIWYILCLSLSLVIDFTLLASLDYKKITKNKAKHILLGAPAGFLTASFIPDLLYYRPYDLTVTQIITIIGICIIGAVLVLKGRKYLLRLSFRKKNQNQKTENNANQKNRCYHCYQKANKIAF